MNITISQGTNMSPTALLYKEKEYLIPLPNKEIIDSYQILKKYTVSNESLIRYNSNRYSVDPELIGKEVSAEVLENKLYIHYNGKLITVHEISDRTNENKYKEEHYRKLMTGKVKKEDMNKVVLQNLEIMDKILEYRKLNVSEIAATKSAEALIAYINQSKYGDWTINYFAYLSAEDKLAFIKGMKKVLPYIANREVFISFIKNKMKENLCQTLDFDCWVNDYIASSESDRILTDEGCEIIEKKYAVEIEKILNKTKIFSEENNDEYI